MIIHQRIIRVIVLVASLLLITLDYYYSEKTNQKDFELNKSEQHQDDESSPCGM